MSSEERPPRRQLSLALYLAGVKLGAIASALLIASITVFALFFLVAGLPAAPDLDTACAVSREARDAIPAAYLELYRSAGNALDLDWAILASIGYVESGHGRNLGPSSAGALGPMQFLPSTWAQYGIDGNGDGNRDIMDAADAIPAAARLLKANGAPTLWRKAIFAYNHASWYVEEVLTQAERYRGICNPGMGPELGDGQLAWPVRGEVTSGFCERRPWERCHPGIDIAVPSGTPVHAADDGTVVLAKPVSGYGYFLCISHTAGLTTCYAHLALYRADVGDRVSRGDEIALSDCTGRCFGPHLHFELRRGGLDGRPIDPAPYLAARP